MSDELTLARRQADEYAREADALRADVARLNARVLDLDQALDENEYLRMRLDRVTRERNAAVELAGTAAACLVELGRATAP